MLQGTWVTEKIIRPRPITQTLFSDRVEGISLATSEAMYKALKSAEILNATDYLRQDPRYISLRVPFLYCITICPGQDKVGWTVVWTWPKLFLFMVIKHWCPVFYG